VISPPPWEKDVLKRVGIIGIGAKSSCPLDPVLQALPSRLASVVGLVLSLGQVVSRRLWKSISDRRPGYQLRSYLSQPN